MTPVKEIGECLITVGDEDYFFRPSLIAMSRIGEPAEIVQTFYDLCNDEVVPFLERSGAAFIRDDYDRLPACVIQYIQSGMLIRKALMASHSVLTACCEDDVSQLIGWMKQSKNNRRSFVWRPGLMPVHNMVVVAQSLMMHGIIGRAKIRRLQRHDTNATTNEFIASDYVIAARNHFGMRRSDAEQLTMTEFQLMLNAKYPEQKGFTREEYDAEADKFFERRKRRIANKK